MVDPIQDIVRLPDGIGYDGWYGISRQANKQLQSNLTEERRLHDVQVRTLEGQNDRLVLQIKDLTKDVESAEWWKRWGFPLGVGIGATVTAVFIWALSSALK